MYPQPTLKRRSFIQALVALFVARTGFARLFARSAPQATAAPAQAFTPAEISTLSAIAEVVLPTTLSADDRRLAVRAFTSWFTNYKQGADMGHGYGAATLRQPSGPSPIARYQVQFAALDTGARELGAGSFAALALPARRQLVEAALNTATPVTRMPAQPGGASLIADFMGMWFSSQAGWNACYQAEINRETCRTLDGSENAPTPIRGGRA